MVTRFREEMSYVFLFIFFFTAAPPIFTLVAASISYFPTSATKFSCCSFHKKKCILRLLSLALAICRSFLDDTPYRNNFRFPFSSLLTLYLSLLHKTRVAMRFPAKITWSCHTCMLIELFYIGMPVVRTDGRAGGQVYGHVTTKISRMHRLPNFFTHGAPLRARESSAIKRVYYRNDFND